MNPDVPCTFQMEKASESSPEGETRHAQGTSGLSNTASVGTDVSSLDYEPIH